MTFRGRTGEVGILRDLIDRRATEGAPTGGIVQGDPGSGKSRLLAEIQSSLPSERTIQLAGYEPEQGVPLAAAAELLRSLAEVRPAGAALSSMLEPGASTEGAVDTLRLFEAAHRALEASGPAVILVDDLQWADDDSIALFHYLIRAAAHGPSGVAFVGASRPSPRTQAFAGSLARFLGARFVAIELGPLERDASLGLLNELAPSLSEERAEHLWRLARGSPFWLEVLAGAGGDEPDIGRIVTERLRTAGSDAAALLALLATIGRPAAVEELAEIQRWPPARAEHAVTELLACGLAVGLGGLIRLAHDLMAEAARQQVPSSLTRHLRQRLADWLETQAGDDESLLLQALEHRSAAGIPVVDLALRLARAPRRRLLGAEGLRRLATIADEAERTDPNVVSLNRQLAALAGELGEHEIALGRWTRLANQPSEPLEAARGALGASRSALELGRTQEALGFLARARSFRVDDVALSIELIAQQSALYRWIERDAEAAHALAMKAVETSRGAATPGVDSMPADLRRAYVRALVEASVASIMTDDPVEALGLSEELATVAAGFEERTYIRALAESALALRFMGRNGDAEGRLRVAWEEAHGRVFPQATLEVGAMLATVLLSLGRLAEAETVATECTQLGERMTEFRPARAFSVVFTHLIQLSTGDWRDATEALRQAAEREKDPHYRLHAWIERAVALGRLDPRHSAADVRVAVEAAVVDADAAGCRRCLTEVVLRGAESLARIGDADTARSLLVRGDVAPADLAMRWWRDRAESVIRMSERNPDAPASLEAAAAGAERQGLLLEAVWVRLDLGAVLSPVDRSAGARVLREAGEAAERMGARTEQRLAEQSLRSLGVRTWRRGPRMPAEPALQALSMREQEIARLVAAGASNPDIAAQLFLSRKTVERHVSNVLAKLGARNRAELASALARRAE